MGITGGPFDRTEVLVPPLEPQERDRDQGKRLMEPGTILVDVLFDCCGFPKKHLFRD